MSLEAPEIPNESQDSPHKIEVKNYIKDHLADIAHPEYDKEWAKLLIAEVDRYYDDGAKKEYFENFFENLSKSEVMLQALRENPGIFNLILSYTNRRVLGGPEDFESLIYNTKERQKEKIKNEEEKHDRILANPYATDEEYRLGTYKESIETQVRDAVFKLQEKGYLPMGSGFDNLVSGSQSIHLNKEEGVDLQALKDAVTALKIPVVDTGDNIAIVISPKDRKISPDEWKTLWDRVVSAIPDIKNLPQGDRNSNNGRQGVEFRKSQDLIREGKNAWLRSGLAFVDGEVVEMSYRDFMNLSKDK